MVVDHHGILLLAKNDIALQHVDHFTTTLVERTDIMKRVKTIVGNRIISVIAMKNFIKNK